MSNMTVQNLRQFISSEGSSKSSFGSSIESLPLAQAAGVNEKTIKFGDLLQKSVDQVNQDQVQADLAIKELVAGRSKNIHETLLTIERADDSLKMMMQVRNKILDAYREVMKIQV